METSAQIVIKLAVSWQTFALVAIILIIAGIAYNRLVDWLQDRHEGYTSLLVAAGVIMTLVAFAIVQGIGPAIIVAALFICSGTPMIAGEVMREIHKRHAARLLVQKEAERLAWENETGSAR